MLILQYLGDAKQLLNMCCVCKSWNLMLDSKDESLWSSIATVTMVRIFSRKRKCLRSSSSPRREYIKGLVRASQLNREKHEALMIEIKNSIRRDNAIHLRHLIMKKFPDIEQFNINWRSPVMEGNTIASLLCRVIGRLKCLRLLTLEYHANLELGDVGGFNPLILSAYHANYSVVVLCVRTGVNIRAVGRERNGIALTAEHWAAVRCNWDIFRYLRKLRLMLLGPGCSHSSYCVCGRGYLGDMVECDNPDCLIGWFHTCCVNEVNLPDVPQGVEGPLMQTVPWLCNMCRGVGFPHPGPGLQSSFLKAPLEPLYSKCC